MGFQFGSKNRLVVVTMFLLFILSLCRLFGEPLTVHNIGLDDFRWKNRLIVISAPSPQNSHLLEQRRLFGGRNEEILDRDLKIIQITGQGQNLIDELPLSRESAAELQSRLKIPLKEFQFLLVGKDGTVKLKSPEPVSTKLIFSLIDSMPMRQREIRESNEP